VLAATDMRFAGITWGPDGSLALLTESEWKSRRSKTWIISPDAPENKPTLLFDRNSEDIYKDPGAPLLRRTELGRYVLAHVDSERRKLLLQGAGASPQGSFPFLDVFDIDTKESHRIWQCSAPHYEFLTTILNDEPGNSTLSLNGLQMLGRRESIDTPPQYFRVTFTGYGNKPDWHQISQFPHPYPTLQGLTKEVLKYERDDGVELNGTLYLPPGYNKERDGALPCIIWAYPREFKSRDTAGQLRQSSYKFDAISSTSPLLFLTLGYAIFDGPSMPIIGEGNAEPNDTYIEQLTSSARAAVKVHSFLVQMFWGEEFDQFTQIIPSGCRNWATRAA
jgi:dipeptidyl aminopeptidase/acylaminoacyl peptidase